MKYCIFRLQKNPWVPGIGRSIHTQHWLPIFSHVNSTDRLDLATVNDNPAAFYYLTPLVGRSFIDDRSYFEKNL